MNNPSNKATQTDMGVYRKTMFDSKPSRIRPVTLVCRLGFHRWPEWRTDTEPEFVDGKKYWSSCRVCERCYRVDLKTGVIDE